MSDYLKHLVARSLNRAPSMQPRLASRFEPLPLAAPLRVSETAPGRGQLDLEDDTRQLFPSEAHTPALRESRQRTANTSPHAHDVLPRSDGRSENRTHVDAGQPPAASSLRLPDQSSPSHVFTPSPGRELAPPSSQANDEPARTPPAQTTEDARLRLKNEDDPPARRPHAPNESALEQSIPRIVAGEFEARDAQAVAEASPRSHARSGKLTRPAVSPLSTVPLQASAATTREQADDSARTSQPIIRVTIGRIEVRAVTQPAPPGQRDESRRATPAEVRPDPARSLREYLKQRSGGRS